MKNLNKKIVLSLLLSSMLTSSLMANVETSRINVLVIKDKGFTSDWKTTSTNLNTRIDSGIQPDINNRKKINAKTKPTTPTVDDSNCTKNVNEVCTLVFNSTDDGTITWNISDLSGNTTGFSQSNNSVSFTVPSRDSYSISATRTDNDNLSSSRTYTFTSLSDKFTDFKNVLVNNCGIDGLTVDSTFDKITGNYNNSLECNYKNLTDTQLNTFTVLKSVNGALFLNNNQLTNLNGLSNLTSVIDNLWINGNQLTSISGLSSLTNLGFNLIANGNQLTNLNGLSGLTSVNYMDFNYNQLTSLNGLSNLTSGGTFDFQGNQLTSLNGISSLSNITGSINVSENIGLNDLNGLSNTTVPMIILDNKVYSTPVSPSTTLCSNGSLQLKDNATWGNIPYSNVCY